jgi:hypothetical protein
MTDSTDTTIDYCTKRHLFNTLLHEHNKKIYDSIFPMFQEIAKILNKDITTLTDFKYVSYNSLVDNVIPIRDILLRYEDIILETFNIKVVFKSVHIENQIITVMNKILKKIGYMLCKGETTLYIKKH